MNIPYQKEIMAHQKKTGHKSYSIRGTNKREKLHGVYCKDCKRFITKIKVVI